MADWYYHDAAQGRVGPLSAEDLQARYRERRIQRDTLVWRDGLREWQPLDRVSEELGLDGIQQDTAKPPPLPPGGPIGMNANTAYAGPAAGAGGVRTDVRYSPQPKRGMSGCLIAVIVLAVLALPVLGILAAIALPAYQDYTLRAKAMQSINEVSQIKLAIAEHMAVNGGDCPSNGDDGFGDPEDYATATTAQIKIGTMQGGHCAIELELRGIGERVDGKTIWFEAIPQDGGGLQWDCSGGDLPAIYRPSTCRPGTSISNG
jgi:type IV pilus assembly protein PilA